MSPPSKNSWRRVERISALSINSMAGGSPLRIFIRVALRKPLPKPSPAYGSRFKNDDRQEGARRRSFESKALVYLNGAELPNSIRGFDSLRPLHRKFLERHL